MSTKFVISPIMTSVASMNDIQIFTRAEKMDYIDENVDDLDREERQEILNLIVNSGIDESKLHDKGDGAQIRYSDLTDESINSIYVYTKNKIEKKTQFINNIVSEESSDDEAKTRKRKKKIKIKKASEDSD